MDTHNREKLVNRNKPKIKEVTELIDKSIKITIINMLNGINCRLDTYRKKKGELTFKDKKKNYPK